MWLENEHLAALLIAISFAAGLNIYATVATLGLLARFGGLVLPGQLDALADWWVIGASATLFAIELVADKIPLFDLIWNAVHTFVRVPAGALLAYAATSQLDPRWQLAASIAGGAIALAAHSAKSAARVAVSPSPEPVSNFVLSAAEDVFTIFITWFATRHPFLAASIVCVMLAAIALFTRWIVRRFRAFLRAAASQASSPAIALLTAGSMLAALGLAGCGSTNPSPAGCGSVSGTVCFGTNSYAEYDVGDLPIVISVPHGGALVPAIIPNRTVGTTVTDTSTIELGRALVQAFTARTGRAPHLVICQLKRIKLDANREVVEAAQGNAEAVKAWNEYHDFIVTAMASVRSRSGRGFYIDLHGHGHDKQRLELGYLLSDGTLGQTDAQIDITGVRNQSSLKLVTASVPFSELLRGPSSLGGLLAPGVPSVPSPAMPAPNGDPYFDGGYSTSRHTTTLAGLQIETNFTGVRDSAASRAAFSASLAAAVVTFVNTYLSLGL